MKKLMRERLFCAVLSVCVFGMAACSSSSTPPTTESVSQPQPAEKASDAGWIKIDSYRFKLEPDVQSDGVAHLDFYVHDAEDKHVKGVTGTFTITKPDGTKAELPVEEETPHDHYHGVLRLDQPGEYLIVAQVAVADKKLNPRFSFLRKV